MPRLRVARAWASTENRCEVFSPWTPRRRQRLDPPTSMVVNPHRTASRRIEREVAHRRASRHRCCAFAFGFVALWLWFLRGHAGCCVNPEVASEERISVPPHRSHHFPAASRFLRHDPVPSPQAVRSAVPCRNRSLSRTHEVFHPFREFGVTCEPKSKPGSASHRLFRGRGAFFMRNPYASTV